MGKIAFVFAGQGAQYAGMGATLPAASPAAAEVFDALERIRPGTRELCFSGTEEELSQTKNTQPALYAVECAAEAALRENGIVPDCCAGFSLGEISALRAAGCVSLETGFRLVTERGRLMQAAAEKIDSAMVAVVKLTDGDVERLASDFPHVYPVNYNCPGQVTVAGLSEEIAAFSLRIKEAGGRAIPLKVSGGFHSPFMEEAALAFAEALANETLTPPALPLYSDVTSHPYDGDIKRLLARQIASPVRWREIVENMAKCGVDTFVELGPGKTLSGFIGKILPGARTLRVDSGETLAQTIGGLSC